MPVESDTAHRRGITRTRTASKIERWFLECRRHRWRFNSAYTLLEWYNNRIHGALDLDCGGAPNEAFIRKISGESLLGLFLDRTAMGVLYD
jgi:hypothetical protein